MLDFASVLRSPPFKVLLDRDRICLTVPKSLAKGLSDPLYALMNNENMKESQDGQATLKDVDADIFIGFCEFAYTNDYLSRMKEQQPEIGSDDAAPSNGEEMLDEKAIDSEEPFIATADALVEEEAGPLSAPRGSVDMWSFGKPDKGKGKQNKITKLRTNTNTKPEKLWSEFQNLTYEGLSSRLTDERLLTSERTSGIKITTSLLYHAKIYVFAEEYLIDSLRILSLRKLHAELRDFDLTVQTSGDILEVLEFTYRHTERKNSTDDQLRILVIYYAACKAEILKQNKGFRKLLEDNGEMACDLFYKSC